MKKCSIFIAMLMASVMLMAQIPYRVDTSYVKYNTFDFLDWVMADSLGRGMDLFQMGLPPQSTAQHMGEVLQLNYTSLPQGLKVVGLSVCVYILNRIPLNPVESLFLYEATPTSFDLLREVQWNLVDTDAAYPYEAIASVPLNCSKEHYIIYTGGTSNTRNWVYEYYFDTAVVVYDSFYVGNTDHRNMNLFDENSSGACFSYWTLVASYSWFPDCHMPPITWKMKNLNQRYQTSPYCLPYNQWFWRDSWQYLLTRPIIELIDTNIDYPDCNAPSGLFVTGNGTDTVTLHWNADAGHSKYIVKYGPLNFNPATSGTADTVVGNEWVYTGPDYSGRQMDAYVRTLCDEYDTVRLSPWSAEPVYFLWREGQHDTADVSVPDQGETFDTYVRVLPNPASDKVQIISSFKIDQVEVYNSHGHKVLDAPLGRTMTWIDVAGWPRGVYVLLLHTSSGTIAKRLVVK